MGDIREINGRYTGDIGRLGGDARELRARGSDAREVGGAALGVEPAEQRRVRTAQPTEPREGDLVQRAEMRRAEHRLHLDAALL